MIVPRVITFVPHTVGLIGDMVPRCNNTQGAQSMVVLLQSTTLFHFEGLHMGKTSSFEWSFQWKITLITNF